MVVLTNLQGGNPEYFIDETGGYYLSDLKQSHGFGLSPGLKKLRAELLKRGFDQAQSVAARLRKRDTALRLPENDLNAWGYLLEQKQPTQAVAILRLNTVLYPTSANTYDSLGEVLELTGDHLGTLKNYRRSLALNPANAATHIKGMEKK